MVIAHHKPGEVVDLRLGTAGTSADTSLLVNTSGLELIRIVLPAGKKIPLQRATGGLAVQCLKGLVSVITAHATHALSAGQLFCLEAEEPLTVEGIQDSSLLLTVPSPERLDLVQEASEESFPASDAPARAAVTGP